MSGREHSRVRLEASLHGRYRDEMRGRELGAWTAVALVAACGDPRYRALEDWNDPPELRVAVLLGEDRAAIALPPGTPLDVEIEGDLSSGRELSVWMFSYDLDTLFARYPALAGRSISEIATLLRPNFESGDEAPEAKEVLSGRISASGPKEIEYTRSSWPLWSAELESRQSSPLFFDVSRELSCSQIAVETFEGPQGVRFDGLVAPRADEAIFAGTRLGGGSDRVQLWRFSQDRFADLGERAGRAPIRGLLTWSPASRSGYGATNDFELFQFDAEGASLAVPDPEFRVREVSAGLDGSLLATDSFSLYVLSGDRWLEHKDFNDQVTKFVELVRNLDRERIFAFSVCWVSRFDGRLWDLELLDLGCDRNTGRRQLLLDVAPDTQGGGIAVGMGGYLALREPFSGRWSDPAETGAPLGTSDLHAAAALGDTRYVAAGARGTLGVYDGRDWCVLRTTVTSTFTAAAAAPDGRTAWLIAPAAGTSPATRTTAVRVTLPP